MARAAFVLVSTVHGALIVNRFDDNAGVGVGYRCLERGDYGAPEIEAGKQLLALRRRYFGDNVMAIDCGANIGILTVEWARYMTGWGKVIGIEAQERIFYALAGNISINNCANANAIHAVLGRENGTMDIPVPDYGTAGSFGSLELRLHEKTEDIGQKIDYAENLATTRMMTIDSLNLARLDLLKIDVERMELDVIEGAKETIARCRPVIIVERVKVSQRHLGDVLASMGYRWPLPLGLNYLAVHTNDPVGEHVSER